MEKEITIFTSEAAFFEMSRLLDSWEDDPHKIKKAFGEVRDRFLKMEKTVLSFVSRPGVSYSLRAEFRDNNEKKKPLYALVDIIDDDPENRWLSICFYEDSVTDPRKVGNLVPQGILGDDGYCFDLEAYDESMIRYVGERIVEAHSRMTES
ncbi:hypothetical protein ACFL0O_09795 [Thermodesulfobacteriota bacterium]